MDRCFYPIAAIRASPEAAPVLHHIMYDLQRRLIAQHRGCELSELQAILDGMNTGHWDLADRFAYCAFLGGLVHIQLSVVAGEDAWIILPAGSGLSREDPVNRVGLQSNGLVCTRAPADALLAWESSPLRRNIPINALGLEAGVDTRVCANCSRTGRLHACAGCKLVRYCGPACQESHWRVGHKPLCKWASACLHGRFGTTSMSIMPAQTGAGAQTWSWGCGISCLGLGLGHVILGAGAQNWRHLLVAGVSFLRRESQTLEDEAGNAVVLQR